MRTKSVIIVVLMLSLKVAAQGDSTPLHDREVTGGGLTVSADVVSRYIWRGQDLGHLSLQPTLGVACKGLSLAVWGSVGMAGSEDASELDLTLSYTSGGLSVGLTDYWLSEGQDPGGRYFVYEAHRTNHVLEVNIGYDFGPIALQWYTNIAGNDGVNKCGDRAYSSYVEIGAPCRLAGLEWKATAGAVPYATSYYATGGFAVTHLALRASKDIQVTDRFALPVFAELSANPCAQKAYLVFGLTLQP